MIEKLVGNLRLWQKFFVLGLLGLVLFLVPAYLYFKTSLDNLATAEAEARGVPAVGEVLGALHGVGAHRWAAAMALGPWPDREAGRQALAADQDKELATAGAAVTRYSGDPALAAGWKKVQDSWTELRTAVASKSLTSAQSNARHDALAQQILEFEGKIVDGSGLSLDPQADSYYLIVTAMMEMPLALEALQQLHLRGTLALQAPVLDGPARLEFAAEAARAKDHAAAARLAWGKAVAANPALKEGPLAAAMGQSGQDVAQALALAGRVALADAHLPEQAQAYAKRLEDTVAGQREVRKAVVVRLGQLLDDRVADARQTGVALASVVGALLLLAVWFARLIVRSVTLPTAQAVRVAGALAQGDLSQTMVLESRDEAGQLAASVRTLQLALGHLVEELRGAVAEANRGNFQRRMDTAGLQGFQLEIADGLNALMATTDRGLSEVRHVLGAVSEGNLDIRIEGDHQGAFNDLKIYTNNTVGVLANLVGQVRRLVAEANRGNFKLEVDTAGMKGFQRDIVVGLNALMVTTDRGPSDALRVLGAISQGQLDQGIDAPYEGAFLELKNYANRTVAVLAKLVEQMRALVAQANRGNFKLQVETEGLQGFQSEIAGGLNALMRTTDQGLSDAVRVLGALSSGRLDETVTADYQGAFEELKRYANNTVSVLGTLVGQLRHLVEQANRGNFLVSVDPTGMQGFQKDIAQGLNALMFSTQTGLADTVRVLGAISRGDLEQRVDRDCEGSFDELKRYANHTVDVLARLVGQLRSLVGQANQGNFAQRVDIQGMQGFSLEVGGGLNDLMQTTDAGLAELNWLLGAMARGDLTERIKTRHQGTFKQLVDRANGTAGQLTTLVGQIKSTAGTISVAAREIAAGNMDLSHRTEQQASNLEQVAASMEELNAAVRQSADNARQANQLAVGASDVADRGGRIVTEVVGTMSSIDQASRKIVDIIAVIDGIAFQTNILALNAAVEAARAGEQGRGFAVVATEVRNLAQRSAGAAREIKALILDSVGRVESGATLVRRAGDTMSEIMASVKRVTDIMGEISAATEEQSKGIDQAHGAVMQMDSVTQQNAALVEQSAAAAASLQDQADGLVDVIGVFVIDQRLVA